MDDHLSVPDNRIPPTGRLTVVNTLNLGSPAGLVAREEPLMAPS
jgi:hypothetical protein